MITQYHNELVIAGGSLYTPEPKGLGIVTKCSYDQNVARQRFRVVRRGGGNDRPALIAWDSLPLPLQKKIEDKAGTPSQVIKSNMFKEHLTLDQRAVEYFEKYRTEDGRPLPTKTIQRYTANASLLNAIGVLVSNTTRVQGKIGRLWKNLPDMIAEVDTHRWPHDLPSNSQSLQRKYRTYVKAENPDTYARVGLESLIHKGFCNDNSSKIKGATGLWWLAKYALPTKMKVPMLMVQYNEVRRAKKWPKLTMQAVSRWLNEKEQQRKWVLGRHGREEYNRRFGHYITRKKDNWFSNAYWAIDGSKLDWIHYEDNVRKMAAKLKINPLIDVYSEKIIGWSYSESEDHSDHFSALKMAANHAGCRPYYLTYDNQSGHKMPAMQALYDRLIARKGTHHPHRPGAHNSPAEGVFSRLQQQVANQWWWSDKQSPMVRTMDSKPNLEFIRSNKHQLKSKQDLLRAWEVTVEKWNNARHPIFKDKTRTEVYAGAMPVQEPLSITDLIELFWVTTSQPVTYRKGGLLMRIGDRSFEFEVYKDDGSIDVDFRYSYVGKKFFVRYDPEFMGEYIQLLQVDQAGNQRVIAQAEPKRTHQVVPILMKEGDKAAWSRDYEVRDKELTIAQAELDELRNVTGITPEKIIEEQELEIKLGGMLPKKERQQVEEQLAITGL